MPGVLDRDVGVLREADADADVDLCPRPPDAGRGIEIGVAAKAIRDAADPHRGLDRLHKRLASDVRTERHVQLVARFEFVALPLETGHRLLCELCDRRQVVPLAVHASAVLFLGAPVPRHASVRGAAQEKNVAAIKRAVEHRLLGHRAPVVEEDGVESHRLRRVLPSISETLAHLGVLRLEEQALRLGVVEDRESRLHPWWIGIRVKERIQLGLAVIAGQRIRVAEEQRIAVGELKAPVEISTHAAADQQLRVFHAIERCRGQAVALQQADRLPLHLRRLAGLHEKRRAFGTREKLGLLADTDPQFVRVDLAIARGGVAAVFVDRVHLRVRAQPLPVLCIELDLHDAELEMVAGVGRLLESPGLPDRQEERGERKPQLKLLVLTLAVVRADLQPLAEAPGRSRRILRGRRGRAEQKDRRGALDLHLALTSSLIGVTGEHAYSTRAVGRKAG